MRCPECGRYVGHENWCPDNPSSLNRNTNHVDNLFNNRFEDDDEPLTSFKRGNDYLDDLKPSGFEPEPHEPYKPLTPEIEPIERFQREKSSDHDLNSLSRPDPMLERPKTIVPDPMKEKPVINSPGVMLGTARKYDYSDTGIRFMADGAITDSFGSKFGRLEGNNIFSVSGGKIGQLCDDGKIMSSDPILTNTFLDKK